MANLSFNTELSSTADANRALVSNIGRAIVKKLALKFEGNEILSIDDFDIFACYQDLWKTASEKKNAVRQGIISTDGCMPNCIRLRINAGDRNPGVAQDKATADAYGNKFIIPLDFEMLDSAALYYQVGLGNRLCYEIKGELQHKNKLISYERAFKMLENNMYITEIGQAILELLSFKVGSGNHQRGISLLQKLSDIFSNMSLVPLTMMSHLTSHNFQILKIEIFSKPCKI